ncbi:MAG: ester cyclase [Woeseiaceae bacterium]
MRFFTNVGVVAIVLTALTACAPDAKEDPAVIAMRTTADAEIAMLAAVDTLIGVWDTKELDKLDGIAASDYKRTAPDQNAGSLDELKAFIAQTHETYPDFSITNDGSAASPDGAFVQWTATGTFAGEGEQTTGGNAFKVSGISRYQFADGKIVSEFVAFDSAAVLAQIQASSMPHAEE